jgi:hypothetical protein
LADRDQHHRLPASQNGDAWEDGPTSQKLPMGGMEDSTTDVMGDVGRGLPRAPVSTPFGSFRSARLQRRTFGLGEALGMRLAIGAITAPLWTMLVIAAAVGALLVALVAVAARKPAVTAGAEPTLASASAAAAPATRPAAALPPSPSAGDDSGAMKALAERDAADRSAAETLAVSNAALAQKLAELGELERRIAADGTVARDPKTIALLRARSVDLEVFREAQRIVAGLEGELGADLLYAIWTGTPGRNEPTALAEALVNSKDVYAKASKALRIALDLRRAQDCKARRELVLQAVDEADQRSLQQLALLRGRGGCGADKRDDCNECLRDDDALEEAIKGATRRPTPKF